MLIPRREKTCHLTNFFPRLEHSPQSISCPGTFHATLSCQKQKEAEGKGGQNSNQLCETPGSQVFALRYHSSNPIRFYYTGQDLDELVTLSTVLWGDVAKLFEYNSYRQQIGPSLSSQISLLTRLPKQERHSLLQKASSITMLIVWKIRVLWE